MRLRQVALVAQNLGDAEAELEDQLGLKVCYRDPGVAEFGLVNALFRVGHSFLEVVSPNQDNTSAGRLLDKRGGDRGYMVLIQVDDLDEMRSRLDAAGARVVFEAEGPGVSGLHVHPRDVGGTILSVDQTDVWDEWPWAGVEWSDSAFAGKVDSISAVEIEALEPVAMASRWSDVLGVASDPTELRLDEGVIRFVPETGRGEGVSAIGFVSPGSESFDTTVCGTRMSVAPRP